jgi:large subunit ribosomal protein L3
MANTQSKPSKRTTKGLLGKKLGMTQVWDENNKLIPVTVVEITPNVVTQVRSVEVDGYVAVQIAYGQIDPRKANKPATGHFAKAGVTPRRHLTELRTADAADYNLGQELTVDTFTAGQLVDVVGTSKGKGFAGVMKRHNFKGVSSSHGSHRNHRKPGSIGASSTPSRVFKGMRMAGRMGGERVTVLNLKVHAVDLEKGLLLVKGAVPGARGRIVFVRNAVKGA